jgi:hypothetical protein
LLDPGVSSNWLASVSKDSPEVNLLYAAWARAKASLEPPFLLEKNIWEILNSRILCLEFGYLAWKTL